jgi:hypothetical protein
MTREEAPATSCVARGSAWSMNCAHASTTRWEQGEGHEVLLLGSVGNARKPLSRQRVRWTRARERASRAHDKVDEGANYNKGKRGEEGAIDKSQTYEPQKQSDRAHGSVRN